MRGDSVAVHNESEILLGGPAGASKAILVIEDDPHDRALLVQTLHKAGYGVEVAVNGVQALAYAAGRVYDAITLDLLLPDMTGLDVLHRIRSGEKNRDTPVVVVTVVADRGLVGGFAVHDYLPKPINSAELLARCGAEASRATSDAPILVVDDDPSALKLMAAALRAARRRRWPVSRRARRRLPPPDAAPPRAIVLDLLMPEMDGFEFLARLRRDPATQETPVIVWTMKELTSDDRDRLRRLAQEVVTKAGGTVALLEQIRAF